MTLSQRQFCVDCKQEHLRDVASGIRRDELRLAGIGRRFVALMIDGLIIGLPFFGVIVAFVGVSVFLDPEAETEWWIDWIGYASIPFMIIYEGLMLTYRGQTLGKMVMQIRVVRPDGSKISAGQAWGRAAVQNLMASFLSIFNYVPAFFTKEKTCLHDLAARTRVISVS